MGRDGVMQEVQLRTPLQTQRLHYGQDALDKAASRGAVAAKRTPTPEHGTVYSSTDGGGQPLPTAGTGPRSPEPD